MRLLLDTHVLLWWLADDQTLSEATGAIAIPNVAGCSTEPRCAASGPWDPRLGASGHRSYKVVGSEPKCRESLGINSHERAGLPARPDSPFAGDMPASDWEEQRWMPEVARIGATMVAYRSYWTANDINEGQ